MASEYFIYLKSKQDLAMNNLIRRKISTISQKSLIEMKRFKKLTKHLMTHFR